MDAITIQILRNKITSLVDEMHYHFYRSGYSTIIRESRDFSCVILDRDGRLIVAPPMFASVYAGPAVFPVVLDPEVGIDFSRMVHGGQEFTWHEPVVAGDEITTQAEFTGHAKRGDLNVFTFNSRSVNQRGELVCEGTWTNIVR